MMMVVVRPFRCKYTKTRYRAGQNYEHNDQARIDFLRAAGYLEGAPQSTLGDVASEPADNPDSSLAADRNAYQLMLKKDLEKLLIQRGISFRPRQSKADLIELLMK